MKSDFLIAKIFCWISSAILARYVSKSEKNLFSLDFICWGSSVLIFKLSFVSPPLMAGFIDFGVLLSLRFWVLIVFLPFW